MRKILGVIFFAALSCSAQTKHNTSASKDLATWKSVYVKGSAEAAGITVIGTNSLRPVTSSRGQSGTAFVRLAVMIDDDGQQLVRFAGDLKLKPTDGDHFAGTLTLDDHTHLFVVWQLNSSGNAMSASVSDHQGLAAALRHARTALLSFDTVGNGRQTAAFSLVGLDEAMTNAGLAAH